MKRNSSLHGEFHVVLVLRVDYENHFQQVSYSSIIFRLLMEDQNHKSTINSLICFICFCFLFKFCGFTHIKASCFTTSYLSRVASRGFKDATRETRRSFGRHV